MTELKPCPFCGGQAKIQEIKNGYKIKCFRCGIKREQRVFRFPTEWLYAKMVDHWNTRNDEAVRQEGAEDAVMKSGIMQLKIDSAVSIARQEEREAIEREIEETVSRYQTESVGQPLSSIRAGNIRGLRQA